MGAIFNMMMEDGIINHNPASRIKLLKEISKIEIDPLNQEEVKVFINKTKEVYPDFYPLAFMAIYTGMLQGELLALTWSDINWKINKIIVSKSYTNGLLGETKTGKTRRIDMSPKLSKVLREQQFDEAVKAVTLDDKHIEYIIKGLKESLADKVKFSEERIASLQAQHKRLKYRLNKLYIDKLDGIVDNDFGLRKNKSGQISLKK